MKKKALSTRRLVVCAMLSAVSIVLGMTPLGIIPLPIANLTTMHIPAILGGILEGPVVGLFVGLIFGLTSLYKAFTAPTSILSPFLQNPLVSLLPRALIGVAAWGVYTLVRFLCMKVKRTGLVQTIGAALAAFFGTMVNTAGVLGMVFLLYAPRYAAAAGIETDMVGKAIWGIVLSNGLLEAAAAMIIVAALERALRPLVSSMQKRERERTVTNKN